MLLYDNNTNEYSFDLSQFDDYTLSLLHQYVQTFFSTTEANNSPLLQRDRRRVIPASPLNAGAKRTFGDDEEDTPEAVESKRRKELSVVLQEPQEDLSDFPLLDTPPTFFLPEEPMEGDLPTSVVKMEGNDFFPSPIEGDAPVKPESKKIRIQIEVYKVEKGTGILCHLLTFKDPNLGNVIVAANLSRIVPIS